MKISVLGAVVLSAIAATAPASAGVYLDAGDTSAYVTDWAYGPQFTNYAFRTTTAAFVGSWRVDDGPSWLTTPIAYSGTGAAALLFGGSASDYFISTIDDLAENADHLAWVSTFGGACGGDTPCGTKVAEDFVASSVVVVPEPSTWLLMVAGFGLTGAGLRRRTVARA